jgi:hypothetical protein
VVGFSKTGSVADAVVAWTQELSCGIAGSDDCAFGVVGALMAVVDGRCVGVFGAVHPVSILNFGQYQSVISFEMFGID